MHDGHDHSHDHSHSHNHDHSNGTHVHWHDGDHDHHLPEEEVALEDNPLWQRDNVVLWSVGIDIGSAGTQILFSRVQLQRQAAELSSRYIVIDRETYYASPVSLTPYRSDTLIDDRALGALVDDAYNEARVRPEDIDTGVVILTGEALRRENAHRIASILSEKCGDLVCATAGHHMEARLAAYGSGAARSSFDRNERIINIDIGGGTTKVTMIDHGKLLETGAIHVGGRLLAVSDEGVIERLDPAGHTHAQRAGFEWEVGDIVTPEQLDAVAGGMADTLVNALLSEGSAEASEFYLTDILSPTELRRADSVVFSGGVAEFFYGREQRDFGDIGRRLGEALRRRVNAGVMPWNLLEDSQGIRATALGASEYTTQLSGNTCYVSDEDAMLPRRNLQVIKPPLILDEAIKATDVAEVIATHLAKFEAETLSNDLVLALNWTGAPRYQRLLALAEGIKQGFSTQLASRKPLYLVLDGDVAMTLGTILRQDLHINSPILVIDGIRLADFDYIDIGRVRQPSCTLPVTIKSLIFNDTLDSTKPERIHHRVT
ncbi:ethanolamine ammonia-lyase reactivating factor EutA [Saccharospirillum sp.]|uniref:ethanolamine ammonia-lyase reactivating factor EutA n=1 Tax=Saccharospirillum sp. TaxID=2033801 RepID=UPI0034A005B9